MASHKQNGDAVLTPPTKWTKSITYATKLETTDGQTIKRRPKLECNRRRSRLTTGWQSGTRIQKMGSSYPSKPQQGSDKYLSDATPNTVPERRCDNHPITRAQKAKSATAIKDAVTVDNSKCSEKEPYQKVSVRTKIAEETQEITFIKNQPKPASQPTWNGSQRSVVK